MKLCKLLLAVVGATVLLGALVGIASAAHLRSSVTTRLSATWTSAEFTGGFGTTRCNLTLEGSLHSETINKTRGLLIGYITRASVGPCPAGSATVLTTTLPWHVQYDSFTGTLPNIASIVTRVIGASWQIRETFGITCLARSEATHPATGTYNLTANAVTSVSLGGRIPTTCGREGELVGQSSTNTAQNITLI